MPKPDVVICSCIYNRWENTLPSYFQSLERTAENVNHICYLVVNEDEKFKMDWKKLYGMIEQENLRDRIKIIQTYNTGLMGYNFGLEAGRIFDCPVLLCNDDTVFGDFWYSELFKIPEMCSKLNVSVNKERKLLDFKKVGVIAPCYVNPGCMAHQKFNPNIENTNYDGTLSDYHVGSYTAVDFCVGHAQLITREAVRAGFTHDPKWCKPFGPFDVYQAMWMQMHEFNILIAQDCCFDFPNSQESHFHEGKAENYKELEGPWKEMSDKLMKEYQPQHIVKNGYNKWYFE